MLIDAALELAEEGGPEAVSVREAARRAGVSPGAPFRHFESRDALMTAVAEEAQRRFRAEIETALAAAPAGDPLQRFRALRARLSALGDEKPRAFRDHLERPAISIMTARQRCRATMPS